MRHSTLLDTVKATGSLAILGAKITAIGAGYVSGTLIKANDTVINAIDTNPEGWLADVSRKSIKRNYNESVVTAYGYLSSKTVKQSESQDTL